MNIIPLRRGLDAETMRLVARARARRQVGELRAAVEAILSTLRGPLSPRMRREYEKLLKRRWTELARAEEEAR